MQEVTSIANQSQWRSRPNDNQFVNLHHMRDALRMRADNSSVKIHRQDQMEVFAGGGDVKLSLSGSAPHAMSHHVFNQISSIAGAKAAHLRNRVHPDIAKSVLNWGLTYTDSDGKYNQKESQVMVHTPHGLGSMVTAVTGPSYGRVYDHECVDAVIDVMGPEWVVPSDINLRRSSTTHTASDRDMWLFLCNRDRKINIDGREMFFGVTVGNSEVGLRSFWLMFFVYDSYCANRMFFAKKDVGGLMMRHTSGAPERFRRDGKQIMEQFATMPTLAIEERLKRAQDRTFDSEDAVRGMLKGRKFTTKEADNIILRAQADEGGIETAFQITNGATAYARSIPHTGERVAFERKASALLAEGRG